MASVRLMAKVLEAPPLSIPCSTGSTRWRRCSAKAAWERFIARATSFSAIASRLKCCRLKSETTPNGCDGSGVKVSGPSLSPPQLSYRLRSTHRAADGTIYMVMEYVEVTLDHELKTRGRFAAREAFEILTPIMSVLDTAHSMVLSIAI